MSSQPRVIMGANIAGIYGAQIFRSEDKPFYRRGFSVAIAVLSVGLLLAIVRLVDDHIRRRRNKRIQPEVSASSDNEGEGKQVLGLPGQTVVVDSDTKAAMGRGMEPQ